MHVRIAFYRSSGHFWDRNKKKSARKVLIIKRVE